MHDPRLAHRNDRGILGAGAIGLATGNCWTEVRGA